MGISLDPDDVAFRVNLVNLEPRGAKLLMHDYSAGHISTDEGRELIESLQGELGNEEFRFYPGVGYRHLLVWRGGRVDLITTPPHDITGKEIIDYLPRGEGADRLIVLMNSSQMIFNEHPQKRRRAEAGKIHANSIWPWGQGKAPHMPSFREKFGLSGAVISAVDLVRGIGVCAGLEIIIVDGATGYIDTNYQGKAEAALKALERVDYVYLHVEAPDEAAHGGNLQHKLQAIEDFDEKVVGPILEGLKKFGDYHTADPVPFILYAGEKEEHQGVAGYDEESARATGLIVEKGHRLMRMLLE